jgi:hypothetical protein
MVLPNATRIAFGSRTISNLVGGRIGHLFKDQSGRTPVCLVARLQALRDGALTRDGQSGETGIGLAITEQAVRLHGGAVSAANAPDGGLIVEIALPATAP